MLLIPADSIIIIDPADSIIIDPVVVAVVVAVVVVVERYTRESSAVRGSPRERPLAAVFPGIRVCVNSGNSGVFIVVRTLLFSCADFIIFVCGRDYC